MVPVALVALVREDVLDHAIFTFAFVFHPVVTAHLQHHSLEMEEVEAPVEEIADVISHATHFRLLFLSLSLSLPISLSLSLAGEGAGGHPGGSPGGTGGPRGPGPGGGPGGPRDKRNTKVIKAGKSSR